MKNVIKEAVKLIRGKSAEKDKAYNNSIDQKKIHRNIEAAEERLADAGLTMCQRQEYQKALDGLKKYKKD